MSHSKTKIFNAISSNSKLWNSEVDVFQIKTKISVENSALIYQKNKALGFLYRERDFLFLRHCFSKIIDKHQATFIIDKSIDSVNHPPFMTVSRG